MLDSAGRMFTSNAKLKTTTRTEPRASAVRGAFRATPSGAPKQVPTTLPPKPAPAPIPKTPSAPVESTAREYFYRVGEEFC